MLGGSFTIQLHILQLCVVCNSNDRFKSQLGDIDWYWFHLYRFIYCEPLYQLSFRYSITISCDEIKSEKESISWLSFDRQLFLRRRAIRKTSDGGSARCSLVHLARSTVTRFVPLRFLQKIGNIDQYCLTNWYCLFIVKISSKLFWIVLAANNFAQTGERLTSELFGAPRTFHCHFCTKIDNIHRYFFTNRYCLFIVGMLAEFLWEGLSGN